MELVPGTPYQVVYRVPSGGEETAGLTYLQTRVGAYGSDKEGELHRFRVLGGDSTDFPELFRTATSGEVEIPGQAIMSAEPLD